MDANVERHVFIKMHRSGETLLLAACDEEILGKRFREGKLRLHVKRDFYGGELVSPEVFLRLIEQCTMANLSGEFVVELAIKNGYIQEENVLYIESIPHAQLLKI
ncbi:MAG: DUF424 family protein [Thermoplasmata archaeon]|nr:DUF424 family protein [Thermoplasmata archaeon]